MQNVCVTETILKIQMSLPCAGTIHFYLTIANQECLTYTPNIPQLVSELNLCVQP